MGKASDSAILLLVLQPRITSLTFRRVRKLGCCLSPEASVAAFSAASRCTARIRSVCASSSSWRWCFAIDCSSSGDSRSSTTRTKLALTNAGSSWRLPPMLDGLRVAKTAKFGCFRTGLLMPATQKDVESGSKTCRRSAMSSRGARLSSSNKTTWPCWMAESNTPCSYTKHIRSFAGFGMNPPISMSIVVLADMLRRTNCLPRSLQHSTTTCVFPIPGGPSSSSAHLVSRQLTTRNKLRRMVSVITIVLSFPISTFEEERTLSTSFL